jgi:hypothetical protein
MMIVYHNDYYDNYPATTITGSNRPRQIIIISSMKEQERGRGIKNSDVIGV